LSGPVKKTLPTARLVSRFNLAFGLMSIIPLLICCYLITVRFFSISILQGVNGVYFLLAVVFALLGLLIGRQVLRETFQQLVKVNTELARLTNQQAGFVGNVAHEFRAPLAIVKGAIDNLADGLHGSMTKDQMEPLAMCRREVNRLSRLVGDLLDLARIEAGKLHFKQEELILQDALHAVANLFSGPLKERGLNLSMELPEAPAKVMGDRDRLTQVFINLFTNAVKFTKTGGIHVRLTTADEAYQVEIEDTGRGIAKEDLERIFDKFEQAGTQNEEGSGLGLTIARDIVQLHHGSLWAESELGRGSRFIVKLPAKCDGH
jgi:signal transduction histidine kinase